MIATHVKKIVVCTSARIHPKGQKPTCFLLINYKKQQCTIGNNDNSERFNFLFLVVTNTEGTVGVCKGPLLDSFSEHKDALCT